MTTIEESIEVAVPIRVAYNQWTQFEDFPHFMKGVESVTQIDNTLLRWKTKIAGVEKEYLAKITEQHPDERVAWRSVDGLSNAGVVTFHHLADDRTKVMVQIDWEPETVVEKSGSALGADDRRVSADLKKFKEFIESRGTATGSWRGDIDQ
jgi:uncharacterized membrane protein